MPAISINYKAHSLSIVCHMALSAVNFVGDIPSWELRSGEPVVVMKQNGQVFREIIAAVCLEFV